MSRNAFCCAQNWKFMKIQKEARDPYSAELTNFIVIFFWALYINKRYLLIKNIKEKRENAYTILFILH